MLLFNFYFQVDKQKNVMAYVARAVDHPECPRKDDMVRVDTYSSYMVIKPRTTFSEVRPLHHYWCSTCSDSRYHPSVISMYLS